MSPVSQTGGSYNQTGVYRLWVPCRNHWTTAAVSYC